MWWDNKVILNLEPATRVVIVKAHTTDNNYVSHSYSYYVTDVCSKYKYTSNLRTMQHRHSLVCYTGIQYSNMHSL